MLFPPSTALLIIPPADACDVLDTWRRRYDPQAEHLPPHITLAYPPFVPSGQWPVRCFDLADILRSVHPFTITLDGVDTFPGIPMILWLRPHQDGTLIRLRGLLETCFPADVQALPYAYTPHLTIGQFDEARSLETARVELAAKWQPVSFLVDRLFFAVQQAGGRWQVRDSVRLGLPA